MSKGFVIEFSVDVADDGDEPDVERFRVLVAGEDCQAFEAFAGRFGETPKYKIVAWGLEGYINADPRLITELPNGLTLIDIGTIKREA
jgi:hypothetical protein